LRGIDVGHCPFFDCPSYTECHGIKLQYFEELGGFACHDFFSRFVTEAVRRRNDYARLEEEYPSLKSIKKGKRFPIKAGSFYPSDPRMLEEEIKKSFLSNKGPCCLPINTKKKKRELFALISPCAGYLYAGGVYAHLYKSLAEDGIPKAIIILGYSTRGISPYKVSIMSKGAWITPFGKVEIDSMLAEKIKEKCPFVKEDPIAHAFESQIEIQLPYIQYIDILQFPKELAEIGPPYFCHTFSFVPIIIASNEAEVYEELGEAITKICKNKHIIIIAIAQFTMYEKADIARAIDNFLIEPILEVDVEKLMERVREKSEKHSMGGFGPAATMLMAAKLSGIKGGKLLKYQTSGDITGDYSSVVGYAGIEFKKGKHLVQP